MEYANSRKQVVKIEKNERRLAMMVIIWLAAMFIAQCVVIYQLWMVNKRNEANLNDIKQFAKCLSLVPQDNTRALLIDKCIEDSNSNSTPNTSPSSNNDPTPQPQPQTQNSSPTPITGSQEPQRAQNPTNERGNNPPPPPPPEPEEPTLLNRLTSPIRDVLGL